MTVRLLMAAELTGVRDVAPGVREFEVAPRHRDAFPPFRGGDHVQLQHVDGTRRDYSLIGSPADPSRYRVAVLRQPAGRGGSARFHDDLAVGDDVFVSYPQPGFRIDPGADRHLFLAGGIGVTAVLGLLHELPPGAEGEVHVCVRRVATAPYLPELAAAGLPVTVHDSSAGTRLDVAALVSAAPPGTTVYCCGPVSLMVAVDEATVSWPPGRVRREDFARVVAPGRRLGSAFGLRLVGSGRETVVAEDESLLHALHRSGVALEYSCEGGICGACVVQSTGGEVDHRDTCLTPAERARGLLAACVSRGRDQLSLLI